MSQDNSETIKKTFSNASLLPEIANILRDGHTVTLTLRGYSMRPFLEDNRDKALLKKQDDVKIGDVVCFFNSMDLLEISSLGQSATKIVIKRNVLSKYKIDRIIVEIYD